MWMVIVKASLDFVMHFLEDCDDTMDYPEAIEEYQCLVAEQRVYADCAENLYGPVVGGPLLKNITSFEEFL